MESLHRCREGHPAGPLRVESEADDAKTEREYAGQLRRNEAGIRDIAGRE
jgi:hypothetical protein